jgi:23S rRNA pseudouridine1911/1915/1917 synthase
MTRQYTGATSSAGSPAPLDDALDDVSADAVERRQVIVPAGQHGSRLDKILVTLASEFSRNHLQGLIALGHVWVDGVLQSSASRKVLAGQAVAVELTPTQESQAFKPQAMPLDIVFEDEHLLVVNKPAGLVVHPAPGNWSGTLLNGLLAHHATAATLPRAGIVHRLDKDTSGLMVVGKTLAAVTALTRQIAARDVHRIYLALCHGRVERASQRIEAPVGRDPRSRVRMAVVTGGRAALTDVERLAVWQDVDGRWISGVRCKLGTGRTHQIRVHMASIGHPLLADTTYGGAESLGLTRQALHATQLGFKHPISAQPLVFDAALPADLAPAWQQVRTAA